MTKLRSILIIGVLIAGCIDVYASDMDDVSCNATLNSEITIEPDVITVSRSDKSEMVVDANNGLFVDDRKINLTPEQQQLLDRYTTKIRETIPMIVDVALEGVEIALNALTEAYYSLFESEPPKDLLLAMNNISESVKVKLRRDGDSFYIHSGKVNGLEETMNELGPKLEQAISESMGSMILAAGKMIKEGDGDLMANIAEFSSRAENMGKEIEAKIGQRAGVLEDKAELLCEKMESLEEIETELTDKIPELQQFDLVRLKGNSY